MVLLSGVAIWPFSLPFFVFQHCAECNLCVGRMDHHCVWINNCVGCGNHRRFLVFVLFQLGYAALFCSVATISLVEELSSEVSREEASIDATPAAAAAAAVSSIWHAKPTQCTTAAVDVPFFLALALRLCR